VRRIRKVKIVATLGPASAEPEMVEALFVAGVDVFRVNMSHSSHEMLGRYHKIIRGIEARRGRPIGILADLQGP
jgi:pyruvate kinase